MKIFNKSLLVGLVSFVSLPGLLYSISSAATKDANLNRMTQDEIMSWKECNKNSAASKNLSNRLGAGEAANKQFIEEVLGVPYQIESRLALSTGKYKNITLQVDVNQLKNNCLVVYGTKAGGGTDKTIYSGTAIASKQESCVVSASNSSYGRLKGTTQFRYIGYIISQRELKVGGSYKDLVWQAVANPNMCHVGGYMPNYANSKAFIYTPDNNPTHTSKIIAQARKGKITYPTKQVGLTQSNRLNSLRSTVDGWSMDYNYKEIIEKGRNVTPRKPIGNFAVANSKLGNAILVTGDLNNPSYDTAANTKLTNYADVTMLHSKYTSGTFQLYHFYSNYWYSGYHMAPQNDPRCSDCDTKKVVDLTVTSAKMYPVSTAAAPIKGDQFATFEAVVKNIGNLGYSGGANVSFTFEDKDFTGKATNTCYVFSTPASKTTATELSVGASVTFKDIKDGKPGCVRGAAFEKFKLPNYTKSGEITVTAKVNHYHDLPIGEASYNNNTYKFKIYVRVENNTSVKVISPKNEFDSGEDINIPVKINNSSIYNVSDKCTANCSNTRTESKYTITRISDNKVVDTGKLVYGNLTSKTGNKSNTTVFIHNKNLDFGDYKLKVEIPDYTWETLPEKWTDNVDDTFTFTVAPVPPANTTCKEVDVPGSKIVKGVKGVTKMCLGYAPNYPSTIAEGGQGTYFLVKYVFLPMPVPAYEITNKDTIGFNQTLKTIETTNRYEPTEEQNFINFPSKNGQIPTSIANSLTLTAPYTVGPHSFYHFKYRGRMMAESVDFTFEIKSPKDQVIARGNVKYKLPVNCYRDDIIDYTEISNCRTVYFYLPNTQNSLEKMAKIPEDKDKLFFKNPGLYSFDFKAVENQKYRYQIDNGYEVQGKEGIRMDGGYTPPYKIPTSVTHKATGYVSPEIKNHCYYELDAFNQSRNVNYCFHDSDKEYQYWVFNYSKPKWFNYKYTAE